MYLHPVWVRRRFLASVKSVWSKMSPSSTERAKQVTLTSLLLSFSSLFFLGVRIALCKTSHQLAASLHKLQFSSFNSREWEK